MGANVAIKRKTQTDVVKGQPADRHRLGLGADSIGKINDGRNENGDCDLGIQHGLKISHHCRCNGAAYEPNEQPGQPVQRTAMRRCGQCRPRRVGSAEDAHHMVQVLHMLVPENCHQRRSWNSANEASLRIAYGERRQSGTNSAACRLLTIGVDPHKIGTVGRQKLGDARLRDCRQYSADRHDAEHASPVLERMQMVPVDGRTVGVHAVSCRDPPGMLRSSRD